MNSPASGNSRSSMGTIAKVHIVVMCALQAAAAAFVFVVGEATARCVATASFLFAIGWVVAKLRVAWTSRDLVIMVLYLLAIANAIGMLGYGLSILWMPENGIVESP